MFAEERRKLYVDSLAISKASILTSGITKTDSNSSDKDLQDSKMVQDDILQSGTAETHKLGILGIISRESR